AVYHCRQNSMPVKRFAVKMATRRRLHYRSGPRELAASLKRRSIQGSGEEDGLGPSSWTARGRSGGGQDVRRFAAPRLLAPSPLRLRAALSAPR
ncbi:MAG TPA: hypothetical protein VGW38_12695, partial [Chloroflexota bacterium]|nr:hypothetical protein [Chloroflexota bacterium]